MGNPNNEDLFNRFISDAKNLPSIKAPPNLSSDVCRKVRLSESSSARSQSFWSTALVKPAFAMTIFLMAVVGFIYHHAIKNKAQNFGQQIVSFEIEAKDAQRIALVGDFNAWDKNAHLLQKDKNGVWHIKLTLEKGSYQYQFLIDESVWMSDPKSEVKIDDGFGGVNSGIDL